MFAPYSTGTSGYTCTRFRYSKSRKVQDLISEFKYLFYSSVDGLAVYFTPVLMALQLHESVKTKYRCSGRPPGWWLLRYSCYAYWLYMCTVRKVKDIFSVRNYRVRSMIIGERLNIIQYLRLDNCLSLRAHTKY